MKNQAEHIIMNYIKAQLHKVKFINPVILHFAWYEPNRRRDKDNVAFAKKFIIDSLVTMKVIEDDGWSYVEGFSDRFIVDKKNPRIEVELEEINWI